MIASSSLPVLVRDQPPQFPDVLDATSIRDYRNCPAKFFYSHCLRRRPAGDTGIHLHAGGAFAAAMEAFRNIMYERADWKELSLAQSNALFLRARAAGARELLRFFGEREVPPNMPKSWEGMLSAFNYCVTEAWRPELDTIEPLRLANGKPAVEFTGAIPLEVNHPDTNVPLLLSARFDMLAQWRDGTPGLLGVDEKTTGALGPSWTRQWDMRSQFLGYTTVAQAYGYNITGFLVRGISILKTKHDHLQVILQFPKHKLARWWEQTQIDVERMVASWRSGEWSQNFDDACAAYGGCSYRPLCEALDPMDWIAEYQEYHWNPLAKDPTDPNSNAMGG